MSAINLVRVFLAVTCCSAVLSVELVRGKPAQDIFKFSMPSKAKVSVLAKRRFRRDANPDDPDVYDAHKEQGKCVNPAGSDGRTLDTTDWKFENETKVSISMAWIGKKSTGEAEAMLLLATTEIMFLFSVPSVLYRSDDFGKTFKQVNAEIFNTHIRRDGGIMKSPVNPNKVILVSHSSPFFPKKFVIVRTDDGGKTWKIVNVPFQITGQLLFHPWKEDWILAKAVFNARMFLSTDFGLTWKFLQSYVRSAKWGARTDVGEADKEERTIFMAVSASPASFLKGDASLMRSRDLGEHFESIHVQHVYTFGLQGKFLYVSVDHNKNNNTRIMHVSKNGGDSWDPVQVPAVTPERFYSILDMSEGMIFLHVDESGDTGRGILYTSDADGIVFSESLKNHVFTNHGGYNDFYKVESMRGTYLTGRMNADNTVTSLISHDRGGEWKTIPLEKKQCDADKVKEGEECWLQIHNRFSASRFVYFAMGPLSVPNAVGIIIAHGNAGAALSRRTDVWMTRDGGYKWYKVLNGTHFYSIGDHGNLIVAVPAYSSTSKYLMYSVNEGRCWFKYEFTEHEFHVAGLVTEPGAKTMRFSMWGFTFPSREWQVITVNFGKVLGRNCQDDEYETWTPHGESKNNGCLLGRKEHCRRPKKGVLCFNGVDYVQQKSSECCTCTLADMECDYGYVRKEGSDKCTLSDKRKPELCLHGDAEKLKDNRGYRLIPGDTCCGGSKDIRRYLDTHQICKNVSWYEYGMNYNYESRNNGGKGGHSKAVFVVIPILLILVIAVVYFGRKYWQLGKFRPTYRYSQLSQEDDDMEGSETFKYNPRPKGLRTYRDYDTDDDDAAMIDL